MATILMIFLKINCPNLFQISMAAAIPLLALLQQCISGVTY